MTASGINSLRTYTVPPVWLLDEAATHGLWVLVGIPWAQHVTFLDDRAGAARIADEVGSAVRSTRHPAVLGYLVGNEIPAPIVRWHGPRRVERFLDRLADAAKEEDPEALVGYANFPSTEYMRLPFFDFSAFNVFLESRSAYGAYLARLHNLASDRPLLITETGLDSRRNGLEAQADAVSWQIRDALDSGCAGVFAFAWTDEWHRGGVDVDDWDFGLVTRDRAPKPALAGASRAFEQALAPPEPPPRVTVVVCTYNGSRTLGQCLAGVQRLRYPSYELLVVIDGSNDGSEQIARDAGARVIATPNHGLSHARNVGLREARGDVVAYIDDDAYPDPYWLQQLTTTFATGDFVAVGGPNLAPADESAVARCVAKAPGGPIHVLLSDREAEHIPGCNMAFRREGLAAIGGFDPRFRIAGDDVDVCWRLQQRGERIGFSPGAVVWHHRRPTVRSYLRQQFQYGKAEALLERKWPEHYNRAGHLHWRGRIYAGESRANHPLRASRVNYGRGGTGLFQSLYTAEAGSTWALPLTPEWGLVVLGLTALSALGAVWSPLLLTLAPLAAALSIPVAEAVAGAERAFRTSPRTPRRVTFGLRCLTAWLWMVQPPARLAGRLACGLAPWRRRPGGSTAVPRPRALRHWQEEGWKSLDDRLDGFAARLREDGGVLIGDAFDRWDIEVRGGMFGAARCRMTVEEHGHGRQLIRARTWPRPSRGGLALAIGFAFIAAGAFIDGAALVGAILMTAAVVLAGICLRDCAYATGALVDGFAEQVRADVAAATPPAGEPGESDLGDFAAYRQPVLPAASALELTERRRSAS